MRAKKAKAIRNLAKQVIKEHASRNDKNYEDLFKNIVNEDFKEHTSFRRPVFDINGKQIGETVFTGQIAYQSGLKFTTKKLKELVRNAKT